MCLGTGAQLSRSDPPQAQFGWHQTIIACAIGARRTESPAMHPTTARVSTPIDGLSVAVHHQPPRTAASGQPRAVLYIHGATFASALSVFHRFDGVSWADTLAQAGFHVYGFDQLGYGDSDRYPAMSHPADANDSLGRADGVARQIHAVVGHIQRELRIEQVNLVAHSWGTTAAALYATQHAGNVGRLVLFAPITARAGERAEPSRPPAWHLVTADAQWTRFVATVPPGAAPVLPRQWFDPWAAAYLASDPEAARRNPPAVRVPYGPVADAQDAAQGVLPYDPALVTSPTLIVRGEWDHWPTDADAQWLFGALTQAADKRDVKIARGTHVMHLETSRMALFRETETFLLGDERA
jgi:pimeloyl-ACP methyl ester carboxylesterase